MKKTALVFAITAFVAFAAQAQKVTDAKLKEKLPSLVPESKVLEQDGREFEVMTKQNTKMEIEFDRKGALAEASGDAATAGDVFAPGQGFISLADAVAALTAAGKTPSGDWSFDKSMAKGWIYEFEGTEEGKKMEYAVDAKSGKLVKSNRDIL